MGQVFSIPMAAFATLITIVASIIIIAIASERKSSLLKAGFYLTIVGAILLIIATLMAVFTAGGKTVASTLKNI